MGVELDRVLQRSAIVSLSKGQNRRMQVQDNEEWYVMDLGHDGELGDNDLLKSRRG